MADIGLVDIWTAHVWPVDMCYFNMVVKEITFVNTASKV